MSEKRKYDSTIARVAGNILGGLVMHPEFGPNSDAVKRSVELARELVAEVERTEPKAEATGVSR